MVSWSSLLRKVPPRAPGWFLILPLVLAVVILLRGSLYPVTSPVPEVLPAVIVPGADRPVQVLYRLNAQAGHEGWTFDLHRSAGNIAYDLGDYDTAAAHWQAALLLQPDDLNLLRQLSELYLMLQQQTEAVDTLRRIVQIAPEDTRSHYYLGLLLASTDRTQAAIHLQLASSADTYRPIAEALLTVLQANPDGLAPALAVGQVLVRHELWGYAETAFRQALENGQTGAVALAYIGLTRSMQGKSGADWFKQAIILEPENATVYYLDGIYERSQGNYDASLNALTLALTYDPRNPAYYVELGSTHQEMGDLVSAEYWFKQAVTVSRGDPQFQTLLDQFYTDNAPLLAASGVTAPEVNAANANIQADMGWTLYRTGSVDEAAQALESALQLDSTNTRAWFYQARIALDQGDTGTAKRLLQQVIDAGKDFVPEAQSLLNEIAQ